MKPRYRIKLSHCIVLGAATLGVATTACAGPEDDYKTAAQSYADGDLISAMPLFKKAADQGYAPAQASLAELLYQSEYYDQAADYSRKSAEQGNPVGQFDLGRMYAEGKGVKKDLGKSREWIVKSAEQGYASAINVMAEAYMHAGLGLTAKDANSEQTLHWLKLAADKDYLPAIVALAQAYQKGTYGAAADPAQAKVWQAKAKEITQRPKPGTKPIGAKADAAKNAAANDVAAKAAPAAQGQDQAAAKGSH
jgi:TPR repeat protein